MIDENSFSLNNDFTAPFFLINLSKRKKRLLSSINQLESLDLDNPIIKMKAVSGDKIIGDFQRYLSIQSYENIINKYGKTALIPTWNALGCAISHLNCWKKIVDYNFQYAFIVEDDIEIINKNQFLQQLHTCIKCMKKQPGIPMEFKIFPNPKLYLFNSNISQNAYNYKYYSDNISIIKGKFTGIHFYAIDLEAAKILIKNMLPFKFQVDIQMSMIATQKNITVINVGGNLIRQNSKFETDVQIPIYNANFSHKLSTMFHISRDMTDLIIEFLGNKETSYKPANQILNNFSFAYNNYSDYY